MPAAYRATPAPPAAAGRRRMVAGLRLGRARRADRRRPGQQLRHPGRDRPRAAGGRAGLRSCRLPALLPTRHADGQPPAHSWRQPPAQLAGTAAIDAAQSHASTTRSLQFGPGALSYEVDFWGRLRAQKQRPASALFSRFDQADRGADRADLRRHDLVPRRWPARTGWTSPSATCPTRRKS